MKELKNIVGKIKCSDNSSGTAFLVAPDMIITAYHVYKGKTPITIDFMAISEIGISGEYIDSDEDKDICLIKLDRAINTKQYALFPLKIGKLFEQDKWKTYGFPNALSGCSYTGDSFITNSQGENFNGRISQIISETSHRDNGDSHWDISLTTEPNKIDNYSGLSGAPLVVADSIIGFIIVQASKMLWAVSFNSVREILERNGLVVESFVQTEFPHDFRIDKDIYPNQVSLQKLNNSIDHIQKGYLFLQGAPGTGKSTLLSHWIRIRQERVIKYYAYISNEQNPNRRGEANIFLYDLIVQIKENGFGGQEKIDKNLNLQEMERILERQLNQLSEDFERNGRKTIVLIDGLDHVPREYYTEKSFLKQLPLPNAIPDGVVFVLGSQKYQLEGINEAVKRELREGNTIEIVSLEKPQMYQIIESYGIQNIDEYKNYIADRCGGNPLYLKYLMQKIRENSDNISECVENMPAYSDNIENLYESYWREISSNKKLQRLLGLFARVKGLINLAFVEAWEIEEDVITDFFKNAKHFFYQYKEEQKLSFFHNSFKQFILQKTREKQTISGIVVDKTKDIEYHKDLANYCKTTTTTHKWDITYHLNEINDYETIKQIANSEYFKEQLLAFRSIPDIIDDIQLALTFAVRRRDLVVMARYLLIATEYSSREYHGKSGEIIHKLIDLGENELAVSCIREGNKLKSFGEEKWNYNFILEVALKFWQADDKEEAKKLYLLAEPLELLNYPIESDRDEREKNILYSWVKIAGVLFDTQEVIIKIENIRWRNEKEEYQLRIYHDLLHSLGNALIESKEWEKLETLTAYLMKKGLDFWVYLRIYQIDILKGYDTPYAKSILDNLIEKIAPNIHIVIDVARIKLAKITFALTKNKETVASLIKDVPIPLSSSSYDLNENSNYKYRMVLYSLKYLLGNEINVNDLPQKRKKEKNRDKEELNLLLLFEKKIAQMAEFSAKTQQKIYEPKKLVWDKYAHSFLSFFYREDSFKLNYSLGSPKEWLLSSFIQITSIYEYDIFYFLFQKFKEEWQTKPNKWANETIKKLLMKFYENGIPKLEIEAYLDTLSDQHYQIHSNTYKRIDDALENVDYYIALENKEKAEKWLSIALKDNMGIGYRKDYQMNEWIRWIERVSGLYPEQRIALTQWISERLPYVQEATEGPAFYRAIELLAENTFKYNSSLGWQLLLWQWDKGHITFETGFSIFLENISTKITTLGEIVITYQLFERILLPIARGTHKDLLKIIINKYLSLIHKSEYLTIVFQIVKSVSIFALPTTRNDYYISIKNICEAKEINIDDIFELSTLKIADKEDVIENILIKDNDTKESLLSSIATGNQYGWFEYYDGGTRINPIKKLIQIDKDLGRSKAFELLESDVKRNQQEFSTHIYEIFSLLTDKLPVKELWEEIKSYLSVMFENAILVEPPILVEETKDISIVLKECVVYLSLHPITCISSEAQSIITKEVVKENPIYIQQIKEWLLEKEDLQIIATQILASVSIKNNVVLKTFESELLTLVQTPNLHIYQTSGSLLFLCGVSQEQLQRKYTPLPKIYEMDFLEPIFEDKSLDKYLQNQAINDSENPYEIIRPMGIYLGYLEEIFNLNMDMLVHRLYELMTQLHQKHEWQFEYENNIRSKMEAIELKFSYPRPRAKIAEKALKHLLMELCDTGYKLPTDIFTLFNPFIPWINPHQRPNYISFLVKKEPHHSFYLDDDWVNEMENKEQEIKDSIVFQIDDNKFILGEYSLLRTLEHYTPTEIRQSVWTFKNELDYGMLMNGVYIQSKNIICQNSPYYSTPSHVSYYLVLNPEFGKFLGWNNDNDYFQWQNSEGELMVESIYWKDGNIDTPPYSNCETGEGWLVLATKKGMEQIKAVCKQPLILQVKVAREKEKMKNTITFSK